MIKNALGLLMLGAAATACSGRYYDVGGMDPGGAGGSGSTPVGSTAGSVTTEPGGGLGAGGGATATDPMSCVPSGQPPALTGPFAEPETMWRRVALFTYGEGTPTPISLPTSTTPAWAGAAVAIALADARQTLGTAPGVEVFLRQALELDADATFSEPWGTVASTNDSFLTALLLAPLPEPNRVGVFTEPSWLETRTTISSRGTGIERTLFGVAVPEPPGSLQNPEPDPTLQDRAALKLQTAAPVCASCHAIIDPSGFALGHFAADGSYRELDHGLPIDTTGSRRTGMYPEEVIEFDGITDFGRKFAEDCNAMRGIAATFTRAAGTLNGAPVDLIDDSIERVAQAFVNSDRTYEDLVRAYIQSPAGLRP